MLSLFVPNASILDYLAHAGDLGPDLGRKLLRRTADDFRAYIDKLFPDVRSVQYLYRLLMKAVDDALGGPARCTTTGKNETNSGALRCQRSTADCRSHE